jgi:hypothetical protein
MQTMTMYRNGRQPPKICVSSTFFGATPYR